MPYHATPVTEKTTAAQRMAIIQESWKAPRRPQRPCVGVAVRREAPVTRISRASVDVLSPPRGDAGLQDLNFSDAIALVPNDSLIFTLVRDVRVVERGLQTIVTDAVAELRTYGNVIIGSKFSGSRNYRDTSEIADLPPGRLHLLNEVCSAMNAHGPWHERPATFVPPHTFMPKPMVGFTMQQYMGGDLYTATYRGVSGSTVDCRYCRRPISLDTVIGKQVMENRIDGVCPHCGDSTSRHQVWHLSEPDSADPAKRRGDIYTREANPKFSVSLMASFLADMRNGLPLRSPVSCVYDQATETSNEAIMHHHLVIGDECLILPLPKLATIYAKPGQKLELGSVWAKLHTRMFSGTHQWLAMNNHDAWNNLYRVIPGGTEGISVCLDTWFHCQAINVGQHMLFPASLVQGTGETVPPSVLYWDISPVERYTQSDSTDFALPPLAMNGTGNPLRISLAPHTLIDARVLDRHTCNF